ncbi:MAG: RagB/SusD family nutrient uptake outer membrane protein [Chitinophagaceae bacterium]|nr:RagB/SusD family nutrient uptake outer membrane protein [Chitinophagaceae bacterium]
MLNTIVVVMLLSGFNSCKIDDQVDPNNPSLEGIEANATVDELNNLVTGMLSGMRNRFDTYLDDMSVIGRDYYRYSGSDPRFTSDLLGKESSVLDPNTFYTTNPWADHYRIVRNGWILRHAVANTTAALTDEEKNGYLGFAKTIQAQQMLNALNMQYQNGIRVDVEDADNPGPFLSYEQSLQGILDLLDQGYTDLTNGGDAFKFTLTSGFAGFDTPSTFAKFNRALAARVTLYEGDFSGVEAVLNQSFFDLAGALTTGVYMVYSTSGGDLLNDAYTPLNSSTGSNARCAQPSFNADAEPGDLRVASKTVLRDEPAFADDLTSNYDVWVYKSNVDPVCIIRNEELILIYAEAKNQTGNSSAAIEAINVIRAAAGLSIYSGSTSQDEVTNEILNQRRYSLFAEGHRWVDMRRYNKLGELPIDRPGDDVWVQFPRPANEEL